MEEAERFGENTKSEPRCGPSEGCRFAWLKPGESDNSGRKVEQILYEEPGKYVIYFVENDYLNAYFIDDYSFYINFSNTFQEILFEIKSYNIKNKKKNEFVRQHIALAYFNALNGYEEIAIRGLVGLSHKLLYHCYVYWILTYLSCCIALSSICLFLSYIQYEIQVREMAYCITSSCMGSLLIYSQKQKTGGNIQYMPIMDALIHFLSSCISGFLIFCILKSNILLGSFRENVFGMTLICFIAGYSEDIPLRLLAALSNMVLTSKDRSNDKS